MYYPPFEKRQTMEYRFKTHSDLIRSLHDKKSCREFLEQQRWNGVPICPHCKQQSERHYKLKREGHYKCKHCRKVFTVTVGTMFEGSKLPLEKWFEAILEFLSNKKGIRVCIIRRVPNICNCIVMNSHIDTVPECWPISNGLCNL